MDAFAEGVSEKGSAYRQGYVLLVRRIALLELLQDPDLYLASVAILRDGTDDLDRNSSVGIRVDSLYDLAESALPKQPNRLVCSGLHERSRLRT